MKKKNNLPSSEYFPVKPTKALLISCIVTLLLCAAAIFASAYRIYLNGIHSFYDVLKYPFLIAVCVFAVTVVISVFVKSRYIVDDKNLITQFGFIKSKFILKDITALELDTQAHKLTIYSGEAYSVIAVDPSWDQKFIRAMIKGSPDIDYSYTLTENKPQNDEDKPSDKDRNKKA